MNRRGFEHDIAVATATFYDRDGFLGVQIDAYGEEKSGLHPYDVHAPFGFASRALDPDTDGQGRPVLGCAVLTALEGSYGHAWLLQDPRVTAKLPQQKKGGSMQYGSAKGAFSSFDGDDGSWTLYIPVSGGAMGISVDASTKRITIYTATGQSIHLQDDGAILLRSATGATSIKVDDTQVTIFGAVQIFGSLCVGNPSDAGAPLVSTPSGMLPAKLFKAS